jgi:hypothetical protein
MQMNYQPEVMAERPLALPGFRQSRRSGAVEKLLSVAKPASDLTTACRNVLISQSWEGLAWFALALSSVVAVVLCFET